jgi:O-methyltransferase involved in polyketide biosynthesis
LHRSNLAVISDPLGDRRLADLLAETAWDRDIPSVVVAEGLIMYLTPAELDRLFVDLHECVRPGSTLLCSSVFARSDGSPRVTAGPLDRPIRAVLRLAGERMYVGIDPNEVPAFFARHSATVRAQPTMEDLRAAYLTPYGLDEERLMPYEHLIDAELALAP